MDAFPTRFIAFCDGSSLANPGGPGGTGFVVFDRAFAALRFGGKRYLDDGDFAVTNNRMELRAVMEALEGLPEGETIEIVTDSTYVIKALSQWIHGWRKRGWKTAEGLPVVNRELIELLDGRVSALKARFTWVRGHDGHALNEIVDGLAQGAARGVEGPGRPEVIAALRKLALLTP